MAFRVRVLAAAALTAGLFTQGASAQTTPAAKAADLSIPCDLPKDAVQTVPAPFDRYMSLVCTAQGQALRPPPGYHWQFGEAALWLTATNPNGPGLQDHYTELTVVPLTDRAVSALRNELHRLTSEPSVFQREIIRMDVTTSSGEHKQMFLLVPPTGAPADLNVLGMECIHFCIPIDKDPWFFVVARDGPPKP